MQEPVAPTLTPAQERTLALLRRADEPVVWWSLVAAFAFMFVLVLAANLFSDAVRDAFDPRVAGRRIAVSAQVKTA